LRSLREALSAITDADLAYGDPRGIDVLRAALAEYLGRVRGVVAAPERVVVTCGYSQGLGLVCRSLAAAGARRIALEDPSFPDRRRALRRATDGAPGLAAPARGDRDRGRLRRGVSLRPRGGGGAPGPRAGPDRLRGLGEQDAGAGPADRLAGGPARTARGRQP